MRVISTIEEFRGARRQVSGSLGLVPTMGYLHKGHLALVRRAKAENYCLAISIFVNPPQFGPGEDLATYPRDMEQDLALLSAEGADLVFNPSADEMYPPGFDTLVEVEKLARRLEGEQRPGHFRAVATVVAKLMNVVRPDSAYFGQKDAQQVAVIRRMIADLDMDIELVTVPTVREPDGLASSSRNMYLSTGQRTGATVIYSALSQAKKLWEQGETSGEAIRRDVRRTLEQEAQIDGIDYVSVAHASNFEELDFINGPALVLVAARLGKARLIDNIPLG